MLRFVAVVLLAAASQAEIIDRVALIVGRQVVTEVELEEEVRVTDLFNQAPCSTYATARQAAADRLVQQELIVREMNLSHYPEPTEADVQKGLDQLREAYSNEAGFDLAVKTCGLDEDILKKHIARQISELEFIQYRFRPELGISESDERDYYNQQAASLSHQRSSPVPTFEESRASIRLALAAKRTDQALTEWLRETRKQVTVIYLGSGLRAPEDLREQ